jgi:osmotically-inducible protein OsmY
MTLLKRCSLFFAAASLLFVLGCASTAKQESTGEYLDDSVITSKVKTAIFAEPSLKVLQINVETTKNVVQLSGDVSSRDEMDKAVEIARSVGGVRSVRNELQLKK